MEIARTVGLFLCQGIWRSTGWRAPGRALVKALGDDDEEVRTIAGMFLVKAGKRAEPLLEEALRQERCLPMVLTVLGDIGDRDLEGEVRQFTTHRDPEVAQAARDALSVLNATK